MDFRDLESFNDAMLAKQLWRMVSQPNLLVSRTLKARCFGGTSIWKMDYKLLDSRMWRSLLSSRYIPESGIRKRIEDGKTINIWEDRWLPEGRDGKVKTPKPKNCRVQMVSELIKEGEWDKELLDELNAREG